MFTVTSLVDVSHGRCARDCSLRDAIAAANAAAGEDTVRVGVAGTMALTNPIAIRDPVHIAGPAVESGRAVDRGITSEWPLTLDGRGQQSDGLVVEPAAAGTTITGLGFEGFVGVFDHGAIRIEADGCTVTGNVFHDNPGRSVWVSGNANRIGGPADGEGNLAFDNGDVAISVTGDRNAIAGNMAGIDATGRYPHPNHNGLSLERTASWNVVGGRTPQYRNIFSGNAALGIHVDGPDNVGNAIENNYLGVGIDAVTPLWNWEGALLDEGTGTIRGHNVMAGNYPAWRMWIYSGLHRFGLW